MLTKHIHQNFMSPMPIPASSLPRKLDKWHLSLAGLIIAWVVGAAPAALADTPSWFSYGRPTDAAHEAIKLLTNAADDGLEASDYEAEHLRNAVENASGNLLQSDDRIAQLDQALTSATRRYLHDLHSGRVDPQQLAGDYTPASPPGFDPDALLLSAIVNGRLTETARRAAPPFAQYLDLQDALARYRKLAGNPAWRAPLPLPADGKLSPGQAYVDLPVLGQRLRLLGDLPADATLPPRYEGGLAEAVRAFQERHGLAPDGVIGKGTLEQLNIAPAVRVRQLELALERLRWTRLPQAARAIIVNVPEFMLRAYEIRDGNFEMKVAMNVIVGNARKTRTPIFEAEMQYIEFSPYWNIPPSIIRGETLPKLRREPAYFDQQGFEFVGRDGKANSSFSGENLDAVQRGEMRIRQRPGARNALGDIKFVFPNSDNIYLHHTPTPQLFKRDRRDFSHGCIRVEAPVELAKFILADEPEWTEERIVQAMTKGKSTTLRLPEPFPVVIAYSTAAVRNGKVHFFPDIYGHDKVLDEALRQHSRGRQAFNQSEIIVESRN
ncbi:MAG: L,D-transpeptidase family protein [Azonexus sp.]